MRWFRGETTELRLQDAGLNFRFEQIQLSDIDAKSSLNNNARVIGAAVDDEVVISYAVKMEERNAAFPAIVVRETGKKYVVIDGNHRLQAYLMIEIDDKPKTLDCYVVEGPEMAIEIATRSFNSANGLGQSHEEKMVHIRHLSRQPGANIKAICSMFGVKRSTVTREQRIWDTDRLLHDLGFRNHGFSRSHLVEIARLNDNQNVAKRVATACIEHGISSDRLNSMVNHVRKYRTEKTRIEAVADFCSGEAKPARNGSAGGTAPNRDKVLKLLNSARIFLKQNPSKEHCHLTSQGDFLRAKGIYEELREHGDKVFGISSGTSKAAGGKRRRVGS